MKSWGGAVYRAGIESRQTGGGEESALSFNPGGSLALIMTSLIKSAAPHRILLRFSAV